MKQGWRTLTEKPIEDILAWVEEAARNGQTVNVGTDSLQNGRSTQFVTVIVVHTPMKGGRVAYCRETVPRIKSLRERLWTEVYKSVNIAMELADCCEDLSVHIDASPETKNKSNEYLNELVGLVMGQGFKAVIKPDSYAASHAADWLVRHNGKLPVGAAC